jgi:hypothetical protein
MKYLLIFLFTISCSSQQKRINNEEPIFTTNDWKRLVVNELEQSLKLNTNSKREQSKILEDITFIKSKKSDFLEKQFLGLGFENKKFNNEDSFYLINNFSRREDHDEYTYILENKNKCHSYFYGEDGFGHNTILKKRISKKRKKCEQKINTINYLENNSSKVFQRDALLILWIFSNGEKKISVIRNVTSSQDDLMENIFYDTHYPPQAGASVSIVPL